VSGVVADLTEADFGASGVILLRVPTVAIARGRYDESDAPARPEPYRVG
jgi:hypothetical protein